MSDSAEREGLSAAKRELLQRLLQRDGDSIPPRTHEGPIPCSLAQERIFVLQQLSPGQPIYNCPVSFELEGPLDTQALEQALLEICRRHEALRSNFVTINGQPHQRIRPAPTRLLERVDTTPDDARRYAEEEAQRPFDLTDGPPLRATLLRIDEQRHLLLLTFHHIVLDAWSLGRVHTELSALYGCFKDGLRSPLRELPIQSADFALWQREEAERGAFDAQLTYWAQALAGAPPLLRLPTDRPRPPLQTFPGDTQWLFLPDELARATLALASETGTTLFMTLFGVFALLLYRYGAGSDLVIGTPVANRDRTELEELIGFFDNTVVLRVNLTGNPSFRELLARVRNAAVDAFEHAQAPFEKVVERINPSRDLSHTPLFQGLFSLDDVPFREPELAGLKTRFQYRYSRTAKFDLHLGWQRHNGGLRAALEYNTDLFDQTTITRFLAHFGGLLEKCLAAPDSRIDALSPLSAGERQLLDAWNRTETPASRPPCIHQLFEEEAQRTPDAAAVEHAGRSLTYGELNRRADQLAEELRRRGAGAGSRIAVLLDRSLEMAIAVLAILKSGGAFVALEATHPKPRLAFVLEDSRPTLVLTLQRLRRLLPETNVPIFDLDVLPSTKSDVHAAGSGVHAAGSPDQIAYVVYTSGSTGRPKGIEMPHRCLTNLVGWTAANLPPFRRLAQLASLGFDVSSLEMFATWSTGATLFIAPEEARRDVQRLAAFIAEHQIDRIILPPLLLQQLAERASASELSSLRAILCMGSPLQITASIRALFARLPACTLHNQYGPSETHVITAQALDGDVSNWPALPPIGRPIANTRIHILDRHLEPVPIGAVGEIYVAGSGLAQGYLERPDLTAERFLPGPFAGERIYQTGDLARRRSDGAIEFLGRSDQQLKVRGFRVEPGEIEVTLEQHPKVHSAAVLGWESNGDLKLVAYLAVDRAAPPSTAELREYLASRLPDYLVPATFVTMDDLPLTSNGKIDRDALAALAPAPAPVVDRPAGALEERLAALWSRLLDVDPVGMNDDFFGLGGHSILAMRLVEEVRKTLGVTLPVMTVFQHPTVAGLAAAMAKLAGSAPTIGRRSDRTQYPLSKNQHYTDVDHPPDVFQYEFLGPLDPALFESSFNEVVRAHEVLRARFTLVDGALVQSIAPHRRLSIAVEDWRQLSENERTRRIAEAELHLYRRFDLAHEPPLRARLLWIADHRFRLLLGVHHLVFDGMSAVIVLRLLMEVYQGGKLEPPFQYADFAAWQQAFYRSPEGLAQLEYWKRQLEGAGEVRLPCSGGAEDGAPNAVVVWNPPQEKLRRLKRFCSEERVSLSTVMTAGFFALVRRWSGADDITLNATYAGRYRPGTENLLGYFAQAWMLRVDQSDSPSFRQLVARVKQVVREAQLHGDVTPVELVDNQRIRFNYLPVMPAPPSEITATLIESTQEAKPHEADLHFELTEYPDALTAHVRYRRRIFDEATIRRLVSDYEDLLDSSVAS